MKKILLSSMMALGMISTANSQVIMSDDFNYANLAALQANWGANPSLSLVTTNGLAAPAGGHDGSAAVQQWTGTFSVTPTDANPLILSGDLWYSGNNNQRNTIGLRQAGGGATPLFEVGFFNSVNNGLGMRVVNFAGGESWVQALSYVALGNGAAAAKWIRVEATFDSDSVTVTYDLNADTTIDATLSSTGTAPANPFGNLRFGGPSGVLSAGGGFEVDNISLTVVPEPSTYALGALGVIGSLIAYRRRR